MHVCIYVCISVFILFCMSIYTALKIDVTMEKSASVAGLSEEGTESFEDIMIKVEMSHGWLLPGTTFPIILRGLFPNGT